MARGYCPMSRPPHPNPGEWPWNCYTSAHTQAHSWRLGAVRLWVAQSSQPTLSGWRWLSGCRVCGLTVELSARFSSTVCIWHFQFAWQLPSILASSHPHTLISWHHGIPALWQLPSLNRSICHVKVPAEWAVFGTGALAPRIWLTLHVRRLYLPKICYTQATSCQPNYPIHFPPPFPHYCAQDFRLIRWNAFINIWGTRAARQQRQISRPLSRESNQLFAS